MIALFMFIGEESPGNPLSLFEFIALKAVAAIALYSCYSIGKYLFHNSLLPDWFVRCLTDIDEDMEDTHEDYFNNIQK